MHIHHFKEPGTILSHIGGEPAQFHPQFKKSDKEDGGREGNGEERWRARKPRPSVLNETRGPFCIFLLQVEVGNWRL